MPEISLSDFVDFAIRSGPAKVTKVREIMERGPYSPALDFWKPLRDGIVGFHQDGSRDKRRLDAILTSLTDRKKIGRYPAAVKAYKKFLGRKAISWFTPRADTWSHAGLDVRINPELGLTIDGRPTVAKLYFKGEARRQDHLNILTEAMRLVLEPKSPGGATMAVIDVARSRMVQAGGDPRVISALLAGEATSFVEIWKALSAP